MTSLDSDTFIVSPGGRLRGRLRVPGDKSISHRAIMLGALAEGTTTITGFLEGEDSLATLAAFKAMGVQIDGPHRGKVIIQGVGLHGLRQPDHALDLGNSGTSMRLLSGLMAGQAFDVVLTGDASLSSRPMSRVIDPLSSMGAKIKADTDGTAPLHIQGGQSLKAMDYTLPMASAQVKSSVLLAGLYAQGKTCVTEPAPTRDHTERMLSGFGYDVEHNDMTVCVKGGGELTATNIDVPADISSAAFFMVGASIAPGSDVTLEHAGVNPTRSGIIDILRLMGADIELLNEQDVSGEPVADIRVRSSQLHGVDIPSALVPLAIDEFPAIFVAAACADGETHLTGAAELRVKESDRLQVMAEGLTSLGIETQLQHDGISIQGGTLQGGEVDSHGDHRIAMAMAMAGLVAAGPVTVTQCTNVSTSFPDFISLARTAGLGIQA